MHVPQGATTFDPRQSVECFTLSAADASIGTSDAIAPLAMTTRGISPPGWGAGPSQRRFKPRPANRRNESMKRLFSSRKRIVAGAAAAGLALGGGAVIAYFTTGGSGSGSGATGSATAATVNQAAPAA